MVLQPIGHEELRERVVERIHVAHEPAVEASLRPESGTGAARGIEPVPASTRPARERPRLRDPSSPLLVPRIERIPAVDAAPTPAPSIHVTIGRVEVRAITDAEAPGPARLRPAVTSLDEYLAPRATGGR
jgi:hypothetical protein